MNHEQTDKVKDRIVELKESLGSRQTQLILYGAGALLLIFVAIFLYRPLAIKLRRAQEKANSLQAQLLIQRETFSILKDLDLEVKIMQQKEISSVIDDITAEGRALGLNFISITPRQTAKLAQNDFQLLPIVFKIECTYQDLGRFLVYLEGFTLGIAEIDSLTIRPKEKVLPKLDLDLVANFYLEEENAK